MIRLEIEVNNNETTLCLEVVTRVLTDPNDPIDEGEQIMAAAIKKAIDNLWEYIVDGMVASGAMVRSGDGPMVLEPAQLVEA